MAWLEELRNAKARAAVQADDPWRLRLERVRGKIDFDNVETVRSQMLLDILEVPRAEPDGRRLQTFRPVL